MPKVLVEDTFLEIQRAARTLARRFDDALRGVGITNGQFMLLALINRSERGGMSYVSDQLGMDRTTLTAALKPLEKGGFVRTKRDPIDRRVKQMALTRRGIAMLKEATPIWEKMSLEIESTSPRNCLGGFKETLRAICCDPFDSHD